MNKQETFSMQKKEGLAIKYRLTQKVGKPMILEVQTSPEVENFFREASLQMPGEDRLGNSPVFRGPNFYLLNSAVRNAFKGNRRYEVMDLSAAPVAFNKDGSGNLRVNIGFIRAVGISKGISMEVNWPLSEMEFKQFVSGISDAFSVFYNQHMQKRDVQVTVNMEEL